MRSRRKKTAKALKGILGVAAIDADAHKELGGQFSIQGFPTIKILGADAKGKVSSLAEYKGERTAAAMVEWALTTAKKLALKRIGAKSSSSSGGSSGGGGGAGPSGGGDSDSFYRKTDVVTLNGRNFESEVIDGDDLWYAERCTCAAPLVQSYLLQLGLWSFTHHGAAIARHLSRLGLRQPCSSRARSKSAPLTVPLTREPAR